MIGIIEEPLTNAAKLRVALKEYFGTGTPIDEMLIKMLFHGSGRQNGKVSELNANIYNKCTKTLFQGKFILLHYFKGTR